MSAREAEVLDAVAAHLSNAQIAGRLHISVRTVESHVRSLLRKFGAADRRELAALAPAATSHVAAVGLPAPWTSFVGRKRERATVLAALGEARLVTLVGPGGVGKTRLAVDAARDAASLFPSGCAFADLVPVPEGFVAQAAASVLGVAERPQQPLVDAVLGHLWRRGGLCWCSTIASTCLPRWPRSPSGWWRPVPACGCWQPAVSGSRSPGSTW